MGHPNYELSDVKDGAVDPHSLANEATPLPVVNGKTIFVSEFVGAGAPTTVPLAYAAKTGQLGQRPTH